MINIDRIVKLVKNGRFYCNAFPDNAGFNPEDTNRIEPVVNNEVIDPNQETVPDSTIAPTEVGAKPTAPLSEEIVFQMDRWVKENSLVINYEGLLDGYTLQQMVENPKESELGPDVTLYHTLPGVQSYKDTLSGKINQANPNIPLENASYLVDIMLAKTGSIMGAVTEREKELEEESYRAKPKQSPVAAPIKTDSDKDEIMQTQFKVFNALDPRNLSEEDKRSVMEALGLNMMYDDERLLNAAQSAFNPGYGADPRFNFFLLNNQFLQPLISKDPNLEGSLLSSMGIPEGDVYSSLSQAYQGGAEAQKLPISVLKQEPYKSELVGILDSLIAGRDQSVLDWLGSFSTHNRTFDARLEGDDEDMSIGNMGIEDVNQITPAEEVAEKMDREEEEQKVHEELSTPDSIEKQRTMTDISKKMSSVVLYYLKDSLDQMKNFNSDTTIASMRGYTDRIRDLKKQIKLDPKDQSLKSALKQAQSGYAHADEMNAFVVSAQKQLQDVFSDLGEEKKSKKQNPNIITYANEFGEVSVPTSVLSDIFGGDALSRSVNPGKLIENHEAEVDKYKERIRAGQVKNPYKPDWRYMVNYRHVYNAMADFGELKKYIKDNTKGDISLVSIIYNNIESNQKFRERLEAYAGVTDKDRENGFDAQTKKIDYLIRTIDQDSKDFDYAVNTFKSKQKFDAKKAQFPPKKYDPTKRKYKEMIAKGEMRTPEQDEEVRKINKEEDRYNPKIGGEREKKNFMHSMKTHVGDNLPFILPSLADFAEQKASASPEEQEAARAYVDLFDHYPTRFSNFINPSYGRKRNSMDEKNRYNTELYYIAKQMPMPDHIKQLIRIDSGEDPWRDKVMEMYEQYNVLYRQAQEQHSYAKGKESDLRDLEKGVTIPSVAKKIEPLFKERNLVKWNKILDKVPDDQKEMFNNYMFEWNQKPIDEKPMIPASYLTLLGLKGRSGSWNTLNNQRKQKEQAALKQQDKAKELEQKIEQLCAENNVSLNIPTLNILAYEYKRAMARIRRLVAMRQASYKFASADSRIIDDMIEGIKKDFNDLFDRLLG